jgi:hypothetical protein
MTLRVRTRCLVSIGVVVLNACSVERAGSGRPGGAAAPPAADSAAAAEVYAALRQYYARLTAREWTLLGQCFWPRAAITTVMRPPRGGAEALETVTIEDAIKRAPAMKDCPVSFSDGMARANVVTYGPLADAWVTYRARCGVARDSVTTHYGIDAFHLMKHEGQWRIASLTFTNEVAGQPLEHQP